MNVSEIARRAGIAPTAVRFYERRGVLPVAARRDNGYREYTDEDLCQLGLVVSLRSLGLDVATAGNLAKQCVAGECDLMARAWRRWSPPSEPRWPEARLNSPTSPDTWLRSRSPWPPATLTRTSVSRKEVRAMTNRECGPDCPCGPCC